MTREEAIADIRDNIKPIVGGKSLDMAIKALEQESCEDYISRKETLKALMDEWTEFDSELMDCLIEKVKKLPSVAPQPKMGRWIKDDNDYEYFWRCNKCNKRSDIRYKYCPNCGRKIQEV